MPSQNTKLGLLAFGVVFGGALVLGAGFGVAFGLRSPTTNRTGAERTPNPTQDDGSTESAKEGETATFYGTVYGWGPGLDDLVNAGKRQPDGRPVPSAESVLIVDARLPSGRRVKVTVSIARREGVDPGRVYTLREGQSVGVRGRVANKDLVSATPEFILTNGEVIKWPK